MIELFDELYEAANNNSRRHCKCGVCNEMNGYSEKAEMVNPSRMECNTCVIEEVGYAQAYVPYQETMNIMSKEKSLCNGTIFSELVQPYVKGSSLKYNAMKRC